MASGRTRPSTRASWSIFDSPDFIADAALHLMATQPDLGIKNPYQLTQEQFDAAIALLEELDSHGAQYWSGTTFGEQITAFAAGDDDRNDGSTCRTASSPRKRWCRRSSRPGHGWPGTG